MTVRSMLALWFLMLALAAAGARAEQAAGEDPLIGAIDEGKTYRKVNGQPINGSEIIDVLIDERWATELAAYRDYILATDEMERAGVAVADADIDAELERQAKYFAARLGKNPEDFKVAELAKEMGVPLDFLKLNLRPTLGLLKVLVKEGKFKDDVMMADPKAKQAMAERLEALAKQRTVLADPAQLAEGEAIRIGHVGHGRDRVRQFIKERLGALRKSEILEVLDKVALIHVSSRELEEVRKRTKFDEAARAAGFENQAAYAAAKPTGEQAAAYAAALKARESAETAKDPLSREDRIFHLSLRVRSIEAENEIPNGQMLLRQQLQQQGMTEEQYINDRAFTIDATITAIARAQIFMKDIKDEYEAHKDKYKRREQKLAHIFIRVRDTQGQPYGPNWQVPNNERMNEYVAKVRDEQFAKARPRAEGLLGPARTDFEGAAKASSDDDKTKDRGGEIGRVGPKTVLPELSVDQHLYEAVKDLKPGEISEPVRSDYGWHIVKCLNNQETTFDEAKERVYLELLKRKRHEILDGLTKKLDQKDFF
ncbi:MAG: peptidylprolyl isomerase [Planctomycetota bacterium]|nr:peptidylprolyl isomerase [Planctomycetota bacterium]